MSFKWTITLYCILYILLATCDTLKSEPTNLIDPRALYNKIIGSDQVGIIEFYSAMCGGCAEFAPTWTRIVEKVKPFMITGKINIDDKAGLKIAQDLGVLDDGVPHIRIFNKKSDNIGTPILKSDSPSGYDDVMKMIKKNVKSQKSEESGIYIKK